jgi:hypothetical protein
MRNRVNQVKRTVPTKHSITERLGTALEVWEAIVDALSAEYGVLTLEWKTSKSDFGWMCALKQKKRTVVYLTPADAAVHVAVVLGERATSRALASDLPESIKALIAEARPYAEGRGIRFSVHTVAEVPIVTDLVAMKMSP